MSIFSEYQSVNKILQKKHPVIFYAESRHYYQYFQQLIEDLSAQNSIPILYITSDKSDPVLNTSSKSIQAVYINRLLGVLFPKLKAGVVVMTMPGLDNHQLFKRSLQVKSYVYVFHAAVSTHQQYEEKAFFNYDAVFCTGNYQVEEIVSTEKKYSLKSKTLIPYGYPLFDAIETRYQQIQNDKSIAAATILIAPSWYAACILNTCIEDLVLQLSKLPYKISIRSHPEFVKREPGKYGRLKKMVDRFPAVSFDESPNVIESVLKADVLITDRSGIALEYAFGTYRPVLFVDTPLKATNSNWKNIGIEPIENSLRDKLGISIQPNELENIAEKLQQLAEKKQSFATAIKNIKSNIFFNATSSYQQGADYILQTIEKH